LTLDAPGEPGAPASRPDDFDYDLPPELIAQTPLIDRDGSRLLVLDRASGAIQHSSIAELPRWLSPGDLLIANNSRVIPARLNGRRMPSGGRVELLLLRDEGDTWRALARPARSLREGQRIEIPALNPDEPPITALVVARLGEGELRIQLEFADELDLERYGVLPLPPYIRQRLDDGSRYQTVYARVPGSAAAPTAGLHFTPELIEQLKNAGIDWAEVTLHVGLDTFRPMTADRIAEHVIHSEWCEVPLSTAEKIAACRLRGNRVVAVGTTAARTIETLGRQWDDYDQLPFAGFTDEFIVPGHTWRLVDALLTNFHLPQSTLLMLVSALAGRETILRAYQEAIDRGYRFFSFGDAMLII
jgi:S-adenosylmethionine:tRNA ribosyltransferase-isomerase